MFSCRPLAIAILSAQLVAAPVLWAANRATLTIGGVDYTLTGHSTDLNTSDDVILTFSADLRLTAVLLTPDGEPARETSAVGSHVHAEAFPAPNKGSFRVSIDGSFADTLAGIEADLVASLPNDQWRVEVTDWSVEHAVLIIEQPAGVVVSSIVIDRVRQR